MIIEYPLAAEADSEARQEEKRKERQIAEARELRTRRELERVAMSKESAVRLGRDARRQELLAVRASCLPGLVFLFHEVGGGCLGDGWIEIDVSRQDNHLQVKDSHVEPIRQILHPLFAYHFACTNSKMVGPVRVCPRLIRIPVDRENVFVRYYFVRCVRSVRV